MERFRTDHKYLSHSTYTGRRCAICGRQEKIHLSESDVSQFFKLHPPKDKKERYNQTVRIMRRLVSKHIVSHKFNLYMRLHTLSLSLYESIQKGE